MAIVLSGTTNDILVNGVSVATDAEVSSAVAPKANTADLKEIGVGQTWQDVTASRVAGTTYTNSTGRPIYINIKIRPAAATTVATLNIGGVIASQQLANSSYVNNVHLSGIIPSEVTYIYSIVTGSAVDIVVTELR